HPSPCCLFWHSHLNTTTLHASVTRAVPPTLKARLNLPVYTSPHSTQPTLERYGPRSVRVGHHARRHRLRAVFLAVRTRGLRCLHQLLVRSIGIAQVRIHGCWRGKRGPHAFEDNSFAAVRIIR